MRLSIIIPNYNYADYVGAAIESALAVEWPDLEVIVVDDGSTDGSHQIIERYGDRIAAIFQENGTQRVACNAGFARSTGEIVIFLDSDDMLEPSIGGEIAAVWGPKVSKIQVQMARMDQGGRLTGSVFPPYNPMPTPEKIRAWMIDTTAYPTPPGSGNAYSRTFLEKLFPLDASCGSFSDSACLAAAPLLGDVVTIAKPLVRYRVHGRNDSNLLLDETSFGREVARALARFRYSQRIGRTVGLTLAENSIFRSLHLLQHRVPSLRLRPADHPLMGDSRGRALLDALIAVWSFPAASRKVRLILTTWAILTLVSPKILAKKLITTRFGNK